MHVILWMSVVLAIGCYICEPVQDPDLWWHITIGRWIWGHGQVPYQEHWNLLALGRPFQAYSWLVELLFAGVDRQFGAKGLISLKLSFGVLLTGTTFYVFGRIAKDWFLGGLVGLIAVIACYNNFTLRPQTLVWVYCVALMYVLTSIERESWNWKRGLSLVLIGCLWANTHLSQIIAMGVTILWLLQAVPPSTLVKSVMCLFVGSILTPYMGAEWITQFQKSSHPFAYAAIAEFKPANITQYASAIFLMLLIVGGLLVQKSPRYLRPGKWILATGITVAGLAVVKFLPFAALIVGALICFYWSKVEMPYERLGNVAQGFSLLRDKWDWLPKQGLSFLFLCIMTVNALEVYRYPVSQEVTPVEAMDFFEQRKLPFPLLNDFGKGGYVMYRLSDERGMLAHPVSIDGRTNVNPPHVYEAFHTAMSGLPGWSTYLDLIQPNSILWPNKTPLISLLHLSNQWCLVFRYPTDRGYSLFVKQSALEQLPEENRKELRCLPSEDASS